MLSRADLHAIACAIRSPRETGMPRLADDLWPFARRVAAAWDEAPRCDPAHASSWATLREQTDELHAAFAEHMDIRYVPDDPYPNGAAIADDVLARRRLLVWTGASEHPLWTEPQNWRFRAVHDLLPHVAKSRPIDLFGELEAYHDHLAFVDEAAELALFTEVVVYACIYYTRGRFPAIQKATAFPELLAEYRAHHCG
jgi:hypothetical protein